jgi:hypothetical protein
MAPSAWWRRWPFLPLPAPDYLRFRLITQYGSADGPPVVEDVLNYLAWCKQLDA